MLKRYEQSASAPLISNQAPLEEPPAKPPPPEIPPLRLAAIPFSQPSLHSSTDGFSSILQWKRQQLETANHSVLELMNFDLLRPEDIAVGQEGPFPHLLVPMEKLMPCLMEKISRLSGWSEEQMLQMAQGTPEQVGELLTGLVNALRSMSQYEEGKEAVLTPQELIATMLVFRTKMEQADGDVTKQQTLAVQAPTASCAEYSLLFVELLRHLKLKPSILSLRPIDQSGLSMTGHSTACIEVSGFLADAAMGQVYPLGKIPAEWCGQEYEDFQEQIKSLYDESINKAQKGAADWPPSVVQRYDPLLFRSDDEFRGLIFLERAIRIRDKDKPQYEEDVLKANELNPADPVAADAAAWIHKVRGDKAMEAKDMGAAKAEYGKAIEIYETAVDLNQESYFANYYAARGMKNIYNLEDKENPDKISLLEIRDYAAKAKELNPKSTWAISTWAEIETTAIHEHMVADPDGAAAEVKRICKERYDALPVTDPFRESLRIYIEEQRPER